MTILEILDTIFREQWLRQIVVSVAVVAGACILYNLASVFIGHRIKHMSSQRAETYLKLIKSVIRYTLIALVIFTLLQINGVDVSSMIAGVGIVSIVLGFAIQDILKDVIKGFVILTDGYYKVGDVINFDETTGKVEAIGLRTTKLLDLYTFNKVSISNRNVEQVEVVSTMINLDVPLPYELKVSAAEKLLENIVNHIKTLDKVENCEYRGINDYGDSALKYHVKVYAKPLDKIQVRRDALTTIFKDLEAAGVEVPYTQIDLHQK